MSDHASIVPEIHPDFSKNLASFLREFYYFTSQRGPLSAMQVWRIYKEREKEMAYKNVRKKLAKLHALGLLTKRKAPSSDLEYRHGEMEYQLSPSGMMTLLLLTDPQNSPVEFSMILRNVSGVPLLKELLSPYFEPRTIQYMVEDETNKQLPLAYELRCYVRDCMDVLLYFNSIPRKTATIVTYYDSYLETIARTFLLKLAMLLRHGPAEYRNARDEIRKVFENDVKFGRALQRAITDLAI